MTAVSITRGPSLRIGLVLGVLVLACAGTGVGATTDDVVVGTSVEPVISITEPTGLDPAPAPQNGTAWVAGLPPKIDLGELQGTEVATGSATWKVDTNAPNGYSLTMTSTRADAPLLRGTAGNFPDMPDTPSALNPNISAFGVAIGDSVGHAQAAVAFAGSPWGTTGPGGTQGQLYRSVPSAGMQIAGRTAPAAADPVTVNFAATLSANQAIPAGAYSGTIRITASTL